MFNDQWEETYRLHKQITRIMIITTMRRPMIGTTITTKLGRSLDFDATRSSESFLLNTKEKRFIIHINQIDAGVLSYILIKFFILSKTYNKPVFSFLEARAQ